MEKLWAPWRIEYIKNCDKPQGCIFCTLPAQQKDTDNLIVYRSEKCFIMLNNYPYNPGHLMVAPFKHSADMYELDDAELLDIGHILRYSVGLLKELLHPDGFNMGVNLGRTAGAGVKDHIHWHIVPRYDGDTNFMPVVADTKVLPESLQSMYDNLLAKIQELGVR